MSILEAVWKQSLYKRRLYVICGARLGTDLLDNRSLAMLLEISKGLIYQTLVSGQPLSTRLWAVASPRPPDGEIPRRGARGAPAASGGAQRGAAQARLARFVGASARGRRRGQAAQEEGQPQWAEVRAIHAPRAPTRGACDQRQDPLLACPP